MKKIEKLTNICLQNNLPVYIVKTKDEAHEALIKSNTRFYCYVLLGDDEALVVGQGSNRINKRNKQIQPAGRCNIIFPGGTAYGHQKALTSALGHLTCNNCLRVLIPTQTKKDAEELEEQIKELLNFGTDYGGKSVRELNEFLFEKRLQQLYPELNIPSYKATDDYKKFKFLIKEIINPSGCEMANFKRDMYEAESLFYPGLVKKVKDLFGGYFSDI
jgi:hypothetical protein